MSNSRIKSSFIVDLHTKSVKPCTYPISIGSNCWICNSTSINAGAVIPCHCVVASNSLITKNKDIANALPGSIIGGIPAKILSTGKYRIFNTRWESILFQWFAEHPNDIYSIPKNVSIEELINP